MVKILYQCEICESVFTERKDAEQCEKAGSRTPMFKVGDVVKADAADGPFEAKVIHAFNNSHFLVSYQIIATDKKRFVRGGGFTRDEEELSKV
jgi:hypothetical protein